MVWKMCRSTASDHDAGSGRICLLADSTDCNKDIMVIGEVLMYYIDSIEIVVRYGLLADGSIHDTSKLIFFAHLRWTYGSMT
jgi:hypothetical protein